MSSHTTHVLLVALDNLSDEYNVSGEILLVLGKLYSTGIENDQPGNLLHFGPLITCLPMTSEICSFEDSTRCCMRSMSRKILGQTVTYHILLGIGKSVFRSYVV